MPKRSGVRSVFNVYKTLNVLFSKLHISNRTTMVLRDDHTYLRKILTIASEKHYLLNLVSIIFFHKEFITSPQFGEIMMES